MACDIDPVTRESYSKNFGIVPKGDIFEISSGEIPEFDILCAGFPCQPFSNIGQKRGLDDPRGTLIYQIVRILKDKKPRAFIFENVKGLSSMAGGEILERMLSELTSAGYSVKYKILAAKDYGVPQIRKRLFIVGTRNDLDAAFEFPEPTGSDITLSDIMKGNAERQYSFTLRVGGRHSGINNRFNWDCYMVDGKPRYITIEECLQLQGFPSTHFLSGNTSDRFRQVGNSVQTTVIREIGRSLLKSGCLLSESDV